MSEVRLTITALQAQMLRDAEIQVAQANARFQAVAGAIIAGHNVTEAKVLRIEPENVLVVEVSMNGKDG